MFSTLWRKLFSRSPALRRPPRATKRLRPRLESLEDRMAPAVLIVNTLADASDHSHLDLREAIAAVDSGSTAGLTAQQKHQVHGTLGHHDTIKFARVLHGTVTLSQGELAITKAVSVAGPGVSKLTIDAHQQSRVFDIPTAGIAVSLSGLTIANGFGVTGSGIYNAGKLTVSRSTLSSNRNLFNGAGGGIFNAVSATLTVTQSTLDGNGAKQGGGIFNAGTLTVSESTLSHNVVGGLGLNVGGGISNGGTLTMTNSTLYANTAVLGGGLYNTGTANLTSVTVAANTAHPTIAGRPAGGGLDAAGGTLLLRNSIVAGNFLVDNFGNVQSASDITGTVSSSSSYNLIGTGGSGGLANGTNHNQVNVTDAKLGSLANNGGPTQTVALLAGSPAIDGGDPALLHTTDQRGVVRKGHVSIGAFQQN
jgi:hypothetical protein